MLAQIGSYAIPAVMVFILVFGLIKKVDVFEAFLEGAKEGAVTTFQIMPAIIAILTAVGMLKASGAMDLLIQLLSPVCQLVGFPAELTPLAIVRPISGSGSLAILLQGFKEYCACSLAGQNTRGLEGCTRTNLFS